MEHAQPGAILAALASARPSQPGRAAFTRQQLQELGLVAGWQDGSQEQVRLLMCMARGAGKHWVIPECISGCCMRIDTQLPLGLASVAYIDALPASNAIVRTANHEQQLMLCRCLLYVREQLLFACVCAHSWASARQMASSSCGHSTCMASLKTSCLKHWQQPAFNAACVEAIAVVVLLVTLSALTVI